MKEKILIVEDEFIVAHDLQVLLEKSGFEVCGIAASVAKAMSIIETHTPGLVLLDIYLKGDLTGIDLAKNLFKLHIPFIYISANSNEAVLEAAKATQPYGFIVKPYKDADVLASIGIAQYRHRHRIDFRQTAVLYLRDFLQNTSRQHISREQKLLQVASAFQPYVPFDFLVILGVAKNKTSITETSIARTRFNEYEIVLPDELLQLSGISRDEYHRVRASSADVVKEGYFMDRDFEQLCKKVPVKGMIANAYSLQSNLCKIIRLGNNDWFMLSFYSRLPNTYREDHLELLGFLEKDIAANLTASVFPGGTAAAAHSQKEKFARTTDNSQGFDRIIGSSPALLNLLDQVKVVAATDTSVLITGESGTGKERVAQNIHRQSPRNGKPMITINCAALPAELIESILFGHEKGSFTGAHEKRTGKFEEANNGTIFLDEIGEMPFDLQKKLLRVLQEREIDRIGGQAPIPINVRLIAATNRSLEKEIAAGRFRLDLYYRLNVFPLHLPPLRERKDDIPLLADYFLQHYAARAGKAIKGIAKNLVEELEAYDWPGNIRELENLVERSVLLTQGSVITENYLDKAPAPRSNSSSRQSVATIKTIEENERDHIIEVLKKCNGKISGEGGAAMLLGIPATTLNSKIKKLGIKRNLFIQGAGD